MVGPTSSLAEILSIHASVSEGEHLADQEMRHVRPRVAFLALEWPVEGRGAGGVGRYAERLARALDPHVDLTVVAPSDARRTAGLRFSLIERWRPLGRFDRYYLLPIRAAREIRRMDVQLVHSHGDDFALLWGRRPRILRTVYGTSLGEARASQSPLRRANHYLLAAIERLSWKRYGAVIAIGLDSAGASGATRIIPPVISDSLDPLPVARDELQVIFIGAFDSRKRGWLALDTAERARARIPGLRLSVIGPREDRRRYPPWVKFISDPSDAEVTQLLAQSSVLLAPSAYEGFGIPVWEALRHGTLAICTPNPGAAFIGHGNFCRIVEDHMLADVLVAFLEAPNRERQRWRDAARQRAAEIAEQASPDRYLDLYASLMLES